MMSRREPNGGGRRIPFTPEFAESARAASSRLASMYAVRGVFWYIIGSFAAFLIF